MPLIGNEEVRARIHTIISAQTPYRETETQKKENIVNFNRLSREGLENGVTEKRILLYETRCREKVYMQFPGIESTREGTRQFPLDARPVLQRSDGTYSADMDFKMIWDIIDIIGRNHRADTDILATIFLRIAYMIGYRHNNANYLAETININSGSVIHSELISFEWNSLDIDIDVLDTLNDRFGLLNGISLEGFLYYNDLLAQNEDCKYSYLQGDKWNVTTGRINNCLSHLTVISHIREYIGISKLIDSFQRTGVAPLPQNRLFEACGDLVERVNLTA